ncbi:MAG: NYN domain-containing protein [Dehalococcoidia bacterium]|nr:NYN domain-containing protein [Dehalococcoidia bacterium]
MRFAVFVDAGYLYAAGASALHGQGGTNRANLELDHPSMTSKLEDLSNDLVRGASLLRIYWYDGILQGQRSQAQQELATADNVKVRLGTVSGGRQKGVDSLIVTDLIELARNHAISDAVVLSGDEDVRIGVQIAQSFGVRIHLIGIEPSRGNQSNLLREEADTNRELSRTDVADFLSIRIQSARETETQTYQLQDSETVTLSNTNELLEQAANGVALSIGEDRLSRVADEMVLQPHWIPNEYDSHILGASRTALGRDLNQSEKDTARAAFREAIQSRSR